MAADDIIRIRREENIGNEVSSGGEFLFKRFDFDSCFFHVEMLKQISVCLLVICCYLVVADPHFRKDKDWLKADAVKGDKPLKMWKPFGWTYWNKDGHYNKDWGKFWYWKLKN